MSGGKHTKRGALSLERYLTPNRAYALSALLMALAVTGAILIPHSGTNHKNLVGAELSAPKTQSHATSGASELVWHHPKVQSGIVVVHYPYMYTVGKSDTLSSIAAKVYNREDAWTLIYYSNHLTSTTISTGEQLKIVKLVGNPPRPPAAPVTHRTTGPKGSPPPTPQPYGAGIWSCIAHYESGGDWSIDTGNGYYGGLQFSAATWDAYGGTAYAPLANEASEGEQIAIAVKVQASQGWGAWPVSSAECGV